ncbi:hypothetical protein C7974DRAFT_40353 [Boeremia exigua]|uniref:uncharacterized protein n=1 Tax=Boeremia exigua TaxID=749465 RepID=UPI001E8D058D|nr:uncharacterized protein C7974DRAFT_40353 [Boeremia exigua]KAH6618998.1 hypothetical protein C7974DRAFT_40353 [Boeremia exigua]
MNYPGYPSGANPDYSPPQEMLSYPDQFGGGYLADNYTTSPEYSLDSFFDQAIAPGDMSSAFPKEQPPFNPTMPVAGMSAPSTTPSNRTSSYPPSRHPSDAVPFGKPEHLSFGFSLAGSPRQEASQPASTPPSLSASPPAHQPPTPDSAPDTAPDSPPPPRARKRGRPRLDRAGSSPASPHSKAQKTGRLPHNQVERKYREGLNAELERLRRAVPSLPQSGEAGAMGQPKPSKAMVLASAIEYIRRLEAERDALKADNARLRGAGGGRTWKVEDESLQEFLTDP